MGSVTLEDIEHDTYTLSLDSATGYDIASSCAPQPVGVLPSSASSTQLYLVPHTTNSLLVDVRSSGGTLIPNASVRLHRGAYDTTITTDHCGQAFFGGISSGSVGGGNAYSIDVSALGYQSYTSNEVDVSGTTRLSVLLN
jgi:hypothetical protein